MGIKEFLQEDDAQVDLKELNSAIKFLVRRVENLNILLAPKSADRMFRSPFQQATLGPGQEAEVYRQDVPPGYIGVVTRMGNDWFMNTSLRRFIDNNSMEPLIQRSLAPTTDPMAVKILVRREVVWRARNDDTVARTFGILTDGFFLPVDLGERIADLEV